MSVQAYDTQLGFALTLGTDALSLRVKSTTPLHEILQKIKTTYQGTTAKNTYIVGELADYNGVTVVIQNSPGLANPTSAAQTVTLTGPTATGASVPESITGSAFVIEKDMFPGFDIASEDLQQKVFVIQYDGVTGPTRTTSS